MGKVVHYEKRDGLAILTVSNPPVNALTHAVRSALLDGFAAAIADEAVQAILLRAQGHTYPAGADIRDFRPHMESPSLRSLCAAIEASPKPVLTAIHGTALGGGLELALACHYRIVDPDAKLGLPDTALGVVPAAGGTQRLARIVGASAALEILVSARAVNADVARKIGLVDGIVQKDLEAAALRTAQHLIETGTPPRPSCERRDGFGQPSAYLKAVAERREALKGDRRAAVHKAVDLVEAALLLPFEIGMEVEHAAYEDLVNDPQAQGLRYAFLAERRTARVPEVTDETARPVRQVALLGGGAGAAAVARACLAAQMRVSHWSPEPAQARAIAAAIEAGVSRDVSRGRLRTSEREALLSRLTQAERVEQLGEADLILIMTLDDAAQREEILSRLGAAAREGAVFASTAPVPEAAAIGAATGRVADTMSMRFFRPVHRVRLAEIGAPSGGAHDLIVTGAQFLRSIRKMPVIARGDDGQIVAPVVAAFVDAAWLCVLAGARICDVDDALRDFGYLRGPFEAIDAAGIVPMAATGRALGARIADPLARMVEMGWHGRWSGRGFYHYGEDGAVSGSTEAEKFAELMRRDGGRTPRDIGAEEIAERCLLAMANAGAALLAEGVAYRASDIDVGMLTGFGFPRWHGGPMQEADRIGVLHLRNRLREIAAEADADFWTPHPLLDEMVRNGRHFDEFNTR